MLGSVVEMINACKWNILEIGMYLSIALLFGGLVTKSPPAVADNFLNHGRVPELLWWTPRLYPHWDTNSTDITCKTGKCLATRSRNFLKHVKADDLVMFLFYGTDLEMEDLPLPRLKSHLWALLHEESPMNNYVLSHPFMIELFNYTATFRRESDYPLTTLFLPDVNYLIRRPPVSLRTKNEHRKRNSAPILYVQSHCDVPSDRDSYVMELSKYVAVDSYGKCLHNKRLPGQLNDTEHFHNEDFLQFIANYKFHLAFENAFCQDYVTEKLFRAFHVGSIPIYRGSPTAKDWSPSDPSLILVDDFQSAKELADFIVQLDSNDAEYEKYLSFKHEDGGITNSFLLQQLKNREWGVNDDDKVDFIRGFECYLCDKLLDLQRSGPTRNQKVANQSHMGCPPPQPSAKMSQKDEENPFDWMNNYWYTQALAKAIVNMMAVNETDSSKIHNYAFDVRDEL